MLRFDLGSLIVKEIIHQKKLNFLHHPKYLASEMYITQVSYDFPGLITECRELLKKYKLPNIIDEQILYTKIQWKKLVSKSITEKSENCIQKEVQTYSKLRNKYQKDNLEMKPYLTQMNLRQSRTMFRARSSMLQVKMNQKSNPAFSAKSWRCDDCLSVDSQSHILWCPAYAPLREGKNLYAYKR